MQFMVEVPDDFAPQVVPAGADPARKALEDMAAEAYRAHRLTEAQLGNLLGLSRFEVDAFLKSREIWLEVTAEDVEREVETMRRLGF